MKDLAIIIGSGIVIYVIGYPLVEWYRKIRDEME